MPLKVLFVCSRNRWRSPTAEQIFADRPGVETASAGTASDAETPLTVESVAWADLIVVMEPVHRTRLIARFGRNLANKRVVCLDISDVHAFMAPALIALLRTKMARHLPVA